MGEKINYLFLGFVILIIFISLAHSCDQGVGKIYYVEATVTDKDIKRIGESDRYLVFTKTDQGESEVMEVTDSLLAGRFNSADVYSCIEIGKKYKFSVRGIRSPLMSWYPNIYDCEEIKND